jgi:hypothetical protein
VNGKNRETVDPLRALRLGARLQAFQESDAPSAPVLMLFDIRSEAICPDCGTRCRRVMNVVKLQSTA